MSHQNLRVIGTQSEVRQVKEEKTDEAQNKEKMIG